MIKHRAARPYTPEGRTRFNLRGRPGCYVIMKNGKPLYVGFSGSDLYKTMYRHFQSWNDPTQIRITYNPADPAIKTRVIYTNTPQQAAKLERALIIKYEPRDNPQKLINYTTTPAEDKTYQQYNETDYTPIYDTQAEDVF